MREVYTYNQVQNFMQENIMIKILIKKWYKNNYYEYFSVLQVIKIVKIYKNYYNNQIYILFVFIAIPFIITSTFLSSILHFTNEMDYQFYVFLCCY